MGAGKYGAGSGLHSLTRVLRGFFRWLWQNGAPSGLKAPSGGVPMRVSSRPVDMIFSIMGIFGVSLDPKAFHPEDRLHATVALMQAILQNQGKASWMGALSGTNPCKQLSSFMEIPALGDQYLQDTSAIFEVLPVDLNGTMDDDGYFQFSAKAVPVVSNPTLHLKDFPQANEIPGKDTEGRFFVFVMTGAWSIALGTQQEHEMFMVLLGRGVLAFDEPENDPCYHYLAILIEKHAPGLFHRSYNRLCALGEGWREVINGWEELTFKLGGREELGPRIPLEQRKKVGRPSTSPAPGNATRKAMLLGAEPTGTQGIGEKLPILVEAQKGRPDAWEDLFSSVWYNYLDTVSDPWDIDGLQLLPELQVVWNLCFPYTKEVVSLDSDIHSLAIQKISEWRRGFVLAALNVLDASLEEEREYSEWDIEDNVEQATPHDDAEYVRRTLGGDNPEMQPFLWGVYWYDDETGALTRSRQFASSLITNTFASHLFFTSPCPNGAEMETNPRAALALSAIAVEHALSFWDPNDRQEDKLRKIDMYFNGVRWAAKTRSHYEAIARLSKDEWNEISSSVNRELSSKRLTAELARLKNLSGRST